MKAIIAALALALAAPLAQAGGVLVIAAGYEPNIPAAHLQLPADYVAVPVSVRNDAKEPVRRTDEMERALRAIAERLRQYPELALKPGVVSLSVREEEPSGMFSSYSPDRSASAQLFVLCPLKAGGVFAATRKIHEAVGALSLGGAPR